jgi:PIN domain nuclease of toxin-antitoxin system
MRALLDTSTFLWFINGSDRLSDNARVFMEEFDNELFMSVASLWEIAIKIRIGKLELAESFDTLLPEKIEENEINILPISFPHLSETMKLPLHHRDPFDRLIIAQGIHERLPLIGCDRAFRAYPIDIIW